MRKKYLYQAAMVSAIATAVVVAAPQADAAFKDVAPNTEAAKAIDKLVSQGIISGYADGTFKPQNNVTRVEAAKILSLINTKGGPVPLLSSNFKDVKQDWSYPYIGYVNKLGLLSGTGNNEFQPNATLTRGQFAKIMALQLGSDIPNIKLPFKDVKKGAWYEDGVKVLLNKNITKGTTATTFSPDAPITREQLAIFIDRANLLDWQTAQFTSINNLANTEIAYNASMFSQLNKYVTDKKSELKRMESEGALLTNYFGGTPIVIKDEENKSLHQLVIDGNTYYINIEFEKEAIKQFKVWDQQKFGEFIKSNSKGSKQLSVIIDSLNNKYQTGALLDLGYNGGFVSVINGQAAQIDLAGFEKDLLYIWHSVANGYNLTVYEIRPLKNDQLKEIDIIDYEIGKQLTPLLEVPFNNGYEVWDVIVVTNGERDYDISYAEYNNKMELYAINKGERAIPNGTKVDVLLYNHSNESEITKTYEYQNGFRFVSEK